MANAERDAIYARVSTDRQEKEQTIETQIRTVRERFGPEGRDVCDEYRDENVPGWTTKRKAFSRLLDDAMQGKFDRVLLYSPDRLWRGKPGGRDALESLLKAAGCTVRYVYGEHEDSDEGEMLAGFQDVLAYSTSKIAVRNMRNGRERRLAEGKPWRGPRPFGWQHVNETGKKGADYLRPVPSELAVVRRIFDLILAGTSGYAVAQMLQAEGQKTTRGMPFSADAVREIVKNPIYTGRTPINRYESVVPKHPRSEYNAERKTSSRERPEAEWVWVDVGDAVVSYEEWQQAKQQLAKNRRLSTRNAKHEYLLRGKLRCGCERETVPGERCGRVLTGRVERRSRRVYRCSRTPTSDPTVTRCCKGFAEADKIEAKVWGILEEGLRNPDEIIRLTDKSGGSEEAWRGRLAAELAEARRKCDGQQRKLDALLELHLAGEVDKATFARKQAELVTVRDTADEQIAHLERELAAMGQRQKRLEGFREYCREYNDVQVLRHTSTVPEPQPDKRPEIDAMVDAVWVYPDGRIEIEGRLPVKTILFKCSFVTESPWASHHNSAEPFTLVIAA